MTSTAVYLAILVLISLLTRSLPRFICPGACGKDAYYHLLAAERIKRNGMRMPATLKEFVLPGIYDYPPLLHYLWALFPFRWHLTVERWSSAVIDAVHAMVVYVFSYYFFNSAPSIQDPSFVAFNSALIFIMSPALLTIGTGPRAYQGTPRTLGELLFSLTLCFSVIGYFNGMIIPFFLAVLFGALLCLTSKFAVQAMVFFYVVFALVTLQAYWIILLVGIFMAALVISKGHYAKVAVGHIAHSRYYLHAISKRFYLLTHRNSWNELKKTTRTIFRNPFRAAKDLFFYHSWTHLLVNHPLLLVIIYILLTNSPAAGHDIAFFLLLWIAAGLVAFILTSLKPFLFLGEAERYLEYALLPQVLYLGISNNLNSTPYIILSYFVGLYLFFSVGFIYGYRNKEKMLPKFSELVRFICGDDTIHRVLPLYLNDAVQLAYESEKAIAHFPANFRKKFMPFEKFFDFYQKIYPFPNEDLKGLMIEYDLDTLYYSSSDLERAVSFGLNYNFDAFKIIFSNEEYAVLQIKPEIENGL